MRPAFPDPQLFLDRADRIDAWNRLQRFLDQRLPLAGGRAALTVTAADPPPAGLPRHALRAGGLDCVVAVADFPFQALTGIPLQASDLNDLAAPLRDALTSAMIETVAAAMPDRYREVRTVAGAGTGPDDLAWAVLTFEGLAPEPIRIVAGASRSAVAAAFADLADDTPGRGPLMAATPVAATATLLRLALPRGRLGALAPGKLLVLARDAENRTALRVGGHVWDLARRDGGWEVVRIGPVETAPVAIDEGEATVSEASGETGAASLTLPVDFDIGGTTVTLADLDGWRVGHVLALDVPRPAEGLAVTIRVGGTPVGTGDLVRIEDRLAVRITALWGAKA